MRYLKNLLFAAAVLVIFDCSSPRELLRFAVYDPGNGTPGLRVEKSGIQTDSFQITIERKPQEESDTTTIPGKIVLTSVPCTSVTLPIILYFERGSYYLDEEQLLWLTALADVLRCNPDARVVIMGYTDSIGNYYLNEELAWNRAIYVSRYLECCGVSAQRIEAYSAGENHPAYDNRYRAGQNGNRRVEILVITPAVHATTFGQESRIYR